MTKTRLERLSRRTLATACVALLVASACSGSDAPGEATGSGGASAAGGAGSGGATSSGGASATSGGAPSGAGGASSGGATAAGGALSTGGAASSGGTQGAGESIPLPPGPCTDAPAGVDIVELGRSPAAAAAAGVIAYRVTYTSFDGTRVQGQMCVPQTQGRSPIIVHNHGGVEGLGVPQWGPIPGNLCHGTASGGAILVEPQYRGTTDAGNNSLLGSIDIRGEGVVEFCSGEVSDSIALMQIAQRRCDASPQQVAMWGESHGGCITLMAASRHPEGLRAAATLVAPVELVSGYEYNAARAPGGTEPPAPGCDAITDHQYISAGFATIFGTPATAPAAYRARSALHVASELVQIPLLMIWGMSDCLIPPTSQGCAMRDALAKAGATVIACHLDSQGQPTVAELPGCSPMGFQPTWPPGGSLAANHYVVFGDGQGHHLPGAARAKEFDAIRDIFLAHAAAP